MDSCEPVIRLIKLNFFLIHIRFFKIYVAHYKKFIMKSMK